MLSRRKRRFHFRTQHWLKNCIAFFCCPAFTAVHTWYVIVVKFKSHIVIQVWFSFPLKEEQKEKKKSRKLNKFKENPLKIRNKSRNNFIFKTKNISKHIVVCRWCLKYKIQFSLYEQNGSKTEELKGNKTQKKKIVSFSVPSDGRRNRKKENYWIAFPLNI